MDRSLPDPSVGDESGSWEIAEDATMVEDSECLFYDGMWKDNSAKIGASAPLEYVLALEGDDQAIDEVPATSTVPSDFAAEDADRAEVEKNERILRKRS